MDQVFLNSSSSKQLRLGRHNKPFYCSFRHCIHKIRILQHTQNNFQIKTETRKLYIAKRSIKNITQVYRVSVITATKGVNRKID